MSSGGNPHPIGKARSLECHFIGECAARRGKERIDGRLIDGSVLGVTLALDGPVVAHFGLGHEVDASVRSPEVLATGKFFP